MGKCSARSVRNHYCQTLVFLPWLCCQWNWWCLLRAIGWMVMRFFSVKVIRRGQSPISVKLVFIQEMFERVKGLKTREPVHVHIIRHVLVATITDVRTEIIKTIFSWIGNCWADLPVQKESSESTLKVHSCWL